MMQSVGILTLGLLSLAFVTTSQTCQPANNCSFYACLETKVPCGPSGYTLSYGEPYCEKFLEGQPSFSLAGQTWMDNVRICLQEQLTPVANGQVSMTCSELNTFAFNSHAGCYTQSNNSICTLPPSDWVKLFEIIGPEEALQEETLRLEVTVFATCGQQYVTNVLQTIPDFGLLRKIVNILTGLLLQRQ